MAPRVAPVEPEHGPTLVFAEANLAGGWADGAEVNGVDDVVSSLVAHLRLLGREPTAVFLNEACESHAVGAATLLGPTWRAFFVQAWDGHSDCFPAPGSPEGRAGNAVLVHDPSAVGFTVPSCNDDGASADRCLPNWPHPAEQRRMACVRLPDMAMCAVHLDPSSWAPHADQLAATARIGDALLQEFASVVLGGDLNASVGASLSSLMDLSGDRDPKTYPSRHPRRALDHVLVGARDGATPAGAITVDLGRCARTFRRDGRCTDHRMLVASVTM